MTENGWNHGPFLILKVAYEVLGIDVEVMHLWDGL